MNSELINRLNQHLKNGMLPERADDAIRLAIAELSKPLICLSCKGIGAAYAIGKECIQQKPLSDDEILSIYDDCRDTMVSIDVARAIEKAHGIG